MQSSGEKDGWRLTVLCRIYGVVVEEGLRVVCSLEMNVSLRRIVRGNVVGQGCRYRACDRRAHW